MNGQFIAQQVTALGGFDWIDIADDVGDGDVGRGQFLDETRVAFNPGDGRGILVQFNCLAAVCADRIERVVVHFRSGDDRDLRVQQIRELANDPALRLPAQSEENQIMSRQNGIDELRHDGLVIAHDAREKFLPPLQFANQVRAHLIFY